MDDIETFMITRPPTPSRPLLGTTVLVVEDSRFACEAMRLLCQRSGARIRRADSLQHARKHLMVYRPTVVIIDLGLPDGSGADLIADLANATPRVEVILGISGDIEGEELAMKAGADGFIAKPIASLAEFQAAILSHLPKNKQPPGPRPINNEHVTPDLIAYRDDLAQIADVLSGEEGEDTIDYVTQFLGGLARSAHDDGLGVAVENLAKRRSAGQPTRPDIARLAAIVQERLVQDSPL